MAYLFLRNPNITIASPDVTPAGGAAGDPVDISCHVVESEISSDTTTTEVPTYCAPSAQVTGPPVYSVAITWNVTIESSDGSDLNAEISPYVGKICTFKLWETGATKGHEFVGLLSENPAVKGTFTPGDRVTADTEFGLVDAPTIVDVVTP